MTVPGPQLSAAHERRSRVIDGRVACRRIGQVNLDRCRECIYLLRLEVAGTPASGNVVCEPSDPEVEVAFTW